MTEYLARPDSSQPKTENETNSLTQKEVNSGHLNISSSTPPPPPPLQCRSVFSKDWQPIIIKNRNDALISSKVTQNENNSNVLTGSSSRSSPHSENDYEADYSFTKPQSYSIHWEPTIMKNVDVVLNSSKDEMKTMVFEALKINDKKKVEQIFFTCKLKFLETDCMDFLIFAIENNATSCLNFFIKNGVHVTNKDSEMLTPLHYAASKGSLDVLNVILENCSKEDVNIVGLNGVTPLYEAASKNRTEIVEKLLEKGADPGYVNDKQYGRTPFHMACRYAKDTKTVKLLLSKKPEIITISDTQGALPSAVLAESNLALAIKIAKYLKSKIHLSEFDRYFEIWLMGIDSIGNFNKTLIKELYAGAYGDFLQFLLNNQKDSWCKFIINKFKKEDIFFIKFLVKNNLLKVAVYDVLPDIFSNLFKADDTGCGIWQFHDCGTANQRKMLLERVMLEIGYTNVVLPFGDTFDDRNTNRFSSQCQREKSLILWSCFSGRYHLVKLLLRASCFDIIPLGILCCQVIQHLLNRETFPSESISLLQKCASECERIARDALEITGAHCGTFEDKTLIQQHLKSPIARYNNHCLFNMAVRAQCSQVLAVSSSRVIIRERWYGILSPFPTLIIWIVAILSYPCFFPLNLMCWLFVKARSRYVWNDSSTFFKTREDQNLKKLNCNFNNDAAEETDEDAEDTLVQFIKKPSCYSDKFYKDRPWTLINMNFLNFIKHLLRTPFVKFVQHVLMHIIFLFTLIIVIMRELHVQPGCAEIVCFIYVLSYVFEELKEVAKSCSKDRLLKYVSNRWNWCDIVALILFHVGFFCRSCLIYESKTSSAAEDAQLIMLFWTRFFYTLAMCLFSMRLLFVYTIHDALGPKLKMINRMISRDLLPFLPILLFFVVPFGIAAQSLSYPNGFAINSNVTMNNGQALSNSFSYSFFAMVGDFQLDNLRGKDCSEGTCPSPLGSKIFVHIFLVVYILVTNVLLMNLLIALFSKTAEETDEEEVYLNVTLIDRIAVVKEFKSKCGLAPPFNILQIIFELVTVFFQWDRQKNKPVSKSNCGNESSNSMKDQEMDFFILQAAALREKREALGFIEDSVEQKIEQICERLEEKLSSKLNHRFGEIDSKLLQMNQLLIYALERFNNVKTMDELRSRDSD